MKKISNVLIVEDHTLVRDALRALLSNSSRVKVVGDAADGWSGVRMFKKLRPDVILMGLSMPLLNGVDALKYIRRLSKDAKVLMLASHHVEETMREVLAAGAAGYICKHASSQDLVNAIESAADGYTPIYAGQPTSVSVGVDTKSFNKSFKQTPGNNSLTDRERQVLKLVAEGYRTKDIAETLFISQKTVEKHRGNVMRKLSLRTVSALTLYCVQRGIIDYGQQLA